MPNGSPNQKTIIVEIDFNKPIFDIDHQKNNKNLNKAATIINVAGHVNLLTKDNGGKTVAEKLLESSKINIPIDIKALMKTSSLVKKATSISSSYSQATNKYDSIEQRLTFTVLKEALKNAAKKALRFGIGQSIKLVPRIAVRSNPVTYIAVEGGLQLIPGANDAFDKACDTTAEWCTNKIIESLSPKNHIINSMSFPLAIYSYFASRGCTTSNQATSNKEPSMPKNKILSEADVVRIINKKISPIKNSVARIEQTLATLPSENLIISTGKNIMIAINDLEKSLIDRNQEFIADMKKVIPELGNIVVKGLDKLDKSNDKTHAMLEYHINFTEEQSKKIPEMVSKLQSFIGDRFETNSKENALITLKLDEIEGGVNGLGEGINSLQDLSEQGFKQVNDFVSSYDHGKQQKKSKTAREAELNGIKSAASALTQLGAFVGLKELSLIGTGFIVAIDCIQAYFAYEDAVASGSNKALAALGPTGVFVNGLLTLAKIAFDIPSEHQQVMQALKTIDDKVSMVYKEMHERFNLIELQLMHISRQIDNAFFYLSLSINDNAQQIRMISRLLVEYESNKLSDETSKVMSKLEKWIQRIDNAIFSYDNKKASESFSEFFICLASNIDKPYITGVGYGTAVLDNIQDITHVPFITHRYIGLFNSLAKSLLGLNLPETVANNELLLYGYEVYKNYHRHDKENRSFNLLKPHLMNSKRLTKVLSAPQSYQNVITVINQDAQKLDQYWSSNLSNLAKQLIKVPSFEELKSKSHDYLKKGHGQIKIDVTCNGHGLDGELEREAITSQIRDTWLNIFDRSIFHLAFNLGMNLHINFFMNPDKFGIDAWFEDSDKKTYLICKAQSSIDVFHSLSPMTPNHRAGSFEGASEFRQYHENYKKKLSENLSDAMKVYYLANIGIQCGQSHSHAIASLFQSNLRAIAFRQAENEYLKIHRRDLMSAFGTFAVNKARANITEFDKLQTSLLEKKCESLFEASREKIDTLASGWNQKLEVTLLKKKLVVLSACYTLGDIDEAALDEVYELYYSLVNMKSKESDTLPLLKFENVKSNSILDFDESGSDIVFVPEHSQVPSSPIAQTNESLSFLFGDCDRDKIKTKIQGLRQAMQGYLRYSIFVKRAGKDDKKLFVTLKSQEQTIRSEQEYRHLANAISGWCASIGESEVIKNRCSKNGQLELKLSCTDYADDLENALNRIK